MLEQMGHSKWVDAKWGGARADIAMITRNWPLRGEASPPRGQSSCVLLADMVAALKGVADPVVAFDGAACQCAVVECAADPVSALHAS